MDSNSVFHLFEGFRLAPRGILICAQLLIINPYQISNLVVKASFCVYVLKAREEYSERSLKSVGLLDTFPYIICPAFNLKKPSDQKVYDNFRKFADNLHFNTVGNDSWK